MNYRKSVSAFILNNKKEFILVLDKSIKPYWKLPSGGIEKNETEINALKREVFEELNIEIDIITKSKYNEKYIWPKEIKDKTNNQYVGQDKTIYLTKIKDNQTIKICEREILAYTWVNINNYKQYLTIKNQISLFENIITEFKNHFIK
jgi:8-oxo-dGTP pyrophosphatase MutT (NUDIX family)